MIYALGLVLILVGLYGVLSKKNMVKIIIALGIMGYGVNLFLALLGYREKGAVDPLLQALVLISLGIGLGILILMKSLVSRLYERYGTLDITRIRRLKG